MKLFALTGLLLSSLALAGGAEPGTGWKISRRAALEAVTEIKVVQGPPSDGLSVLTEAQFKAEGEYLRSHQGIYTVLVRSQGHSERIYVSPGAAESSKTVNTVRVHLNAVIPTPAQREALVRVALGFFNVCWPAEAQSLGDSFWQARLTRPWEKDRGWQDGKSGILKVSWGAGEAFSPFGSNGPYRAALELAWPADGGRCAF